MKRITFFLFFALFALAIQAQQVGPNLSWDNASHSFGDIKEADGKVTHKFAFTNTGNAPLVITAVKPSCGCTSSDYTKAPVKPGEKGYVSATFNPANRPGKFSKSISVSTNATPPVSSIRFNGNVIKKPKTKKDIYPREMGKLWLSNIHLSVMKISNTETKEESVKTYNDTDEDLKITFTNVPNHIKIKAVPEVLKPKAEGTIVVTYDASKKNDWGFLRDIVYIAINGDTQQNKNRFSISATIHEDFSKLTEKELANAPKIEFENKVFNFGTIKQGERRSYDFKFKNTGKKDLIIRKIKSSCGCTVAKPEVDVIKPGKSSVLKATFNSAGKSNTQNKSITVITNDPKQAQLTLRITGKVLKPETQQSPNK